MKKVYPGIWTPRAETLCYECHGPNIERGKGVRSITGYDGLIMPYLSTSTPEPPYATCDRCNRLLHTGSEAVDMLATLRDRLNAILGRQHASMDQTGGMCAALSVPLYLTGHRLAVYDAEEISDAPTFLVTRMISECDDGDSVCLNDGNDMEATIRVLLRLLTEDGIPVPLLMEGAGS